MSTITYDQIVGDMNRLMHEIRRPENASGSGAIPFSGFPVFVSPDVAPRQIRFPRSKKRRIREKWARKNENWTKRSANTIPDGQVVRIGEGYHMNPRTYANIANPGYMKEGFVPVSLADHLPRRAA